MKNHRRADIPSGKGQEGKRLRGRFSILVLINVKNVVRHFINVVNQQSQVNSHMDRIPIL